MADTKEVPSDVSASPAEPASGANASDETAQATAPPTTHYSSPSRTDQANDGTSNTVACTADQPLSVTVPAPQSSDDSAAAPAPSPISKSPTGAYVNPAMRRMLERQDAARQKQKKKAGGGGFGSFLFGGGSGSGSRRPSKDDDEEKKEGAADQEASSSSPADISQSNSREDDDGDEATYAHGLRPGDHVYRWSHFGYTYPIQIHGIVLDTSSDASEEVEEEEDSKDDGGDDIAEGSNGDATNDEGKDKEEMAEAAGAELPSAPKCQKIVWVKIADFGFTRKGDDDDNNTADGNNEGDDADAVTGSGSSQTAQARRHRHQEHADGTATAPASLHSSTNDLLEGQDEDAEGGPSADADADEINPTESEDTTGSSTDIPSAASICSNGEEPADNTSAKPPRPKSLKKSEESFLAQHLKKGKRLNVITLTDPKDIKKWRKVNYGGKGLFGGSGDDGGDEDNFDNNTDENKTKEDTGAAGETSDDAGTNKKEVGGNRFTSWLRSNPSSRCTSPTTTDAEAGDDNAAAGEPNIAQATPSTDFGDLDAKETSEHEDQSAPSSSKSKDTSKNLPTPTSANDTNPEKTEPTEPKTLEEMVAAANAVDIKARQSPRRKASEDAESSGKQDEADKTVRKSSSLANIWPFKKTGDAKEASGENGDDDKSKQSDPSTASKSDPAKIVLARVRFLLENEDDVLPSYHVFNSNSECIAVWCKTGRWSSLQSDVFWHTTAIGNAKSTTLMGLSLAATQPWLIPALPVAAVAAIGTPYLVLRQSKKKCEEATRQLTDGFWAQADPEVYVEAIETWSGIPA